MEIILLFCKIILVGFLTIILFWFILFIYYKYIDIVFSTKYIMLDIKDQKVKNWLIECIRLCWWRFNEEPYSDINTKWRVLDTWIEENNIRQIRNYNNITNKQKNIIPMQIILYYTKKSIIYNDELITDKKLKTYYRQQKLKRIL